MVQWSGLLRYLGIFALFLIVYWLMLRPVKKQLIQTFRDLPARLALPMKAGQPTAAIEVELPPGTEQARRASTLKRQLAEKVKSEPASASRLVQGWIREEAKS